jgi:hypothetical protein
VGCLNEFEIRDGTYVVSLMNSTDHLKSRADHLP